MTVLPFGWKATRCLTCDCVIPMPESTYNDFLQSHANFHCYWGHSQHFTKEQGVQGRLAELQRERDRLAIYEERDRIARDLHDLVIQRLFATGMMLEGAARLADLPPVFADRVSAAVDELDGTIKEIRTTIFGLNEVGDGPTWVGPRARVLAEIERASVQGGPRPSVTFAGPVDSVVDVERAGQLVAAVREGLSNAVRHARCKRIEVQVAVTDALLTLAVLDDGVGVPAGEAPRVSGLSNLDRRAQALGGGCELRARGDGRGGAELRWWVELE